MREILFRGKLKSNDEWSFGNLNVSLRAIVIITPDKTPIGKYGQIIPETVGQFTGLTDKNGKKIFEGDIIRQVNSYDNLEMTGVVRFSKSSQFVISHTYTEKENCYKRGKKKAFAIKTNCEIIGNIYDNPELLDVEE